MKRALAVQQPLLSIGCSTRNPCTHRRTQLFALNLGQARLPFHQGIHTTRNPLQVFRRVDALSSDQFASGGRCMILRRPESRVKTQPKRRKALLQSFNPLQQYPICVPLQTTACRLGSPSQYRYRNGETKQASATHGQESNLACCHRRQGMKMRGSRVRCQPATSLATGDQSSNPFGRHEPRQLPYLAFAARGEKFVNTLPS